MPLLSKLSIPAFSISTFVEPGIYLQHVSVEVNDLDKLYGAISEIDIAKALEVEGFTVDQKTIVIENPIDELGIFEIGIHLHSEVTAKIRLWVTKK